MKCKFCKNDVPDGSIFCNHCGERLAKSRARKKGDVSVPKPRQQKSGEWISQIMVNGERYTVKGKTLEEYTAKAKALKTGLIKAERAKAGKTLKQACEAFNASRSQVLSPSTISGYETIIRTRFKSYMPKDMLTINWQQMINAEAALCSPKTLKNAWGYVCTVLAVEGIEKPAVRLPQLVSEELPWLTPDQIPIFLEAIKDKPCELAALFALHSLRKSELVALKPENIRNGRIYIEGARVRDKDNQLVYKKATKNKSSRRSVKLRIPRLIELLEKSEVLPGEFYVTISTNNLHTAINDICDSVGLPHVGCHGLRRSFASLCYYLGVGERETMRDGGWSDIQTMHKKYIKLDEEDDDAPDVIAEFYAKLSAPKSPVNDEITTEITTENQEP